jgi:heptosyltransferase-1
VLPKLNLQQLAALLKNVKAAVAVDTGLGHLAAALSVPTLSLYGATNPHLTGTVGAYQFHLAAQFACSPCLQSKCSFGGSPRVKPPCFSALPPSLVWNKLQQILKGSSLH